MSTSHGQKLKKFLFLVSCRFVGGLTTQSCLMAIRRFCSKRGVPEEFMSDNGTYFKAANKEMQKKINEECADRFTSPRTRWTFIPPDTPHMAGVWKRMVRSIKSAIKALADGDKLSDEILLTVLATAEDMINARPLTYIPQHSAEVEAISPNHFLRGPVRAADTYLEVVSDPAEALRDLYKRSQYLAGELWNRWIKEYLPSINHRTKWFEDPNQICIGDLVFVVDGNNRKIWTRGIVEEVFPGSDGRIRQVSVRTSRGTFKRATANLAPLEIRDGKSGTARGPTPELRPGDCYGTTGCQSTVEKQNLC